jgi:hypothetical protein
VVEVLEDRFVCIEYNGTQFDGIPDDVPAMSVLNYTWDNNPYCRVAFRSEWVFTPDGKYMLGVTPCNHDAAKNEATDIGRSFEQLIETSLARFARIRSHERGSEAERLEAERIDAERKQELREIKPCWLDTELMTEHYVKTVLAQGDEQEGYERRYCQIFYFEEPALRRQAIEKLSVYAEKRADFRFAERLPYLSDHVAFLLQDPDPDVRLEAARALYHFRKEPVPDLAPEELVAAADELWWKGRERLVREDEATFRKGVASVWPMERVGGGD